MPIKDGDKIKVEYTGTLEDGSVFDSSEKQGKPLEFEVGKGEIIPGFEEAVKGMEKDQEKEIKLTPDKAYGERKDQMIQKVPKDKMPQDQEVKEGMALMVGLPNGAQLPAKVVEVGEQEVTIDVNHPLAGKTLNFKLKVVGVNE
ncbi:MAG: FKBP-type peptidyl-prolyl cis-trans isomerase [Nanobdellota archaeon]